MCHFRGIYVANTYGSSMVSKVVFFLFDICGNVGQYVDHISSAVGHINAVWQAYLFRGIYQ